MYLKRLYFYQNYFHRKELKKMKDDIKNNVKLYLKETLNRRVTLYTLDSIKHTCGYVIVCLNCRYGNHKIEINYSEILKYFSWRNDKFLPVRNETVKQLPITDKEKEKMLTNRTIFDLFDKPISN